MSYKSKLTISFIVFMCITWLYPAHPMEQLMHSSMTFAGLYLVWWLNAKHPMSNFDFSLVMLFIAFHTIGARWLYSYVPYNEFIYSFSTIDIDKIFGFTRNNYDRFIHFIYGLLLTPAIVSQLRSRHKTSELNLFIFAISIIVITSVIYEWMEWLVAIGLSPADAEAYNGQQGDMWDAHKDMLLATVGSSIWYFKYKDIKREEL